MSIKIDKSKLSEVLGGFLQYNTLWTENVEISLLWQDPYWVLRMPAGSPTVNQGMHVHATPLNIGFKMKVVCKIENPATGRDFFPLFTEPWHAGFEEFQGFNVYGATPTYRLLSRAGDVQTSTTLTGQDWTVERTLEVQHTASATTGWVNGAQVAQNTANISTVKPRIWYSEIMNSGGYTFATEGRIFIRPDSIGRLVRHAE